MRRLTVILPGPCFDQLRESLSAAFGVTLEVGRETHRRVARGATERYLLRLVDRKDLLGPALDEAHHVLEVDLEQEQLAPLTEEDVLGRLEATRVAWDTFRWKAA